MKKKYLKTKKKLITILKKDPDADRRKTAAFLLAHIKDGQELINILVPSIFDPDASVRNNVMRVLGEALYTVNPRNFNINPIMMALDFPETTDRNKALYIMSVLANHPKYARYIAKNARKPLMSALKMRQPNLHDNAYNILRQISRKSYGDRDYASWEMWFSNQRTKIATH